MYIPTQFYGKLNSCISASGGDEIGEFYSGSAIWKYHKFTTLGSGSFTIHSGSTGDARVFLVAGGGGGGRTTEGVGVGSPQGAGGGGAGGVVYTDYRLGPNSYTLYVGDGGTYNVSGQDTWIQMQYLPSNYPYYAPTASHLTADGGGRGAYFSGYNGNTEVNAQGGGSGGGAARGLLAKGYTTAVQAGGLNPQGFGGGSNSLAFGPYWDGGAGGGGAAEAAAAADAYSAARKVTRGGNGRAFNVDGTSRYYAGGGGGMGENNLWASTTSLGSNYYGGGGSGSNTGFGGSPGTIDGHDKREGRQGIAVILYPVCDLELTDCTTYLVNGQSTGGTFTYIPCGSTSIETFTLDPLDEVTICSYPITTGTDLYPKKTGTVTYSNVGSCDTYIPPVNPPSCGTGSLLTPTNTSEIVVSAPAVGPYPGYIGFEALQYDNIRVGFSLGSGTYSKCFISGSLRPTTITIGATYTTSYSSNICAYYCETTGSQDVTSGSIVNVNIPLTNAANYTTSSQITLDWTNDEVTMEIWAGSSQETNTAIRSIMNLNDNNAGGDRDFMEIRYLDTNSTFGLRYVKVFGNYFDGTTDTSTPQGGLVNSEWNHHVLTWNKATGLMIYYRNGSEEGQASVPSVSSELTNPYLNVGITDTGTQLGGYYGEYRIYPFALDSTQVLYNYNQTKGRYGY